MGIRCESAGAASGGRVSGGDRTGDAARTFRGRVPGRVRAEADPGADPRRDGRPGRVGPVWEQAGGEEVDEMGDVDSRAGWARSVGVRGLAIVIVTDFEWRTCRPLWPDRVRAAMVQDENQIHRAEDFGRRRGSRRGSRCVRHDFWVRRAG
jgi:hypothetical protein